MKQLAIIGAGASGLAAAYAFRDADVDVTLFEKSRGVSGRAATRRRDGFCYDHGANYFHTDTPPLERLVYNELPADDLVTIEHDVWTFEADGRVQPGDRDRNAAAKYTYRDGISRLGKLLVEASGATLHTETLVQALVRTPRGWHIEGAGGDAAGPFDAVLLTPPAPQAASIVSASTLDAKLQAQLVTALHRADYRSQFTVILAFEQPIPRTEPYYALVNTDAAHPIAWLSFEDDKPGHVPAGKSLLVAQMAPHWTQKHYEAARDELTERTTALVAELLGSDLPPLAWSDHQRWRYALPTAAAGAELLRGGEDAGLFFAGDALIGRGRVARALETGFDVAVRIRASLAA